MIIGKKCHRLAAAAVPAVTALFLFACAAQPPAAVQDWPRPPADTPVVASGVANVDVAVAEEPQLDGQQADIPTPVQPQPQVKAPARAPAFDRADVVWIQQRLKDLGYYEGDVDGEAGEATQGAIEAYQADQGLKVDGRPTKTLREFIWRNGG